MGQKAALEGYQTIIRHKKGNADLTEELVKLTLDQYDKDKNIDSLRMELQKIAMLCNNSRPHA
jgi:hypothetical protein